MPIVLPDVVLPELLIVLLRDTDAKERADAVLLPVSVLLLPSRRCSATRGQGGPDRRRVGPSGRCCHRGPRAFRRRDAEEAAVADGPRVRVVVAIDPGVRPGQAEEQGGRGRVARCCALPSPVARPLPVASAKNAAVADPLRCRCCCRRRHGPLAAARAKNAAVASALPDGVVVVADHERVSAGRREEMAVAEASALSVFLFPKTRPRASEAAKIAAVASALPLVVVAIASARPRPRANAKIAASALPFRSPRCRCDRAAREIAS